MLGSGLLQGLAVTAKNLVGSFHQPRLVLADTDVLATLPRRELLAGYAEVAKYGLMGDADFWTWLEARGAAALNGNAALLRHAIVESCTGRSGWRVAIDAQGSEPICERFSPSPQ